MKTIPLTQGQQAIVDDDDFEKYKHFKWFAHRKGNESKYLYAVRAFGPRTDQQKVHLHIEIAKPGPGMVVDHINHNTLDNRKANLRVCSKAENCRSRKGANRNSKTGIRGVSWKKQNRKFQVSLRVAGKDKFIGYFDDIEKAREASVTARKHYFGEFAGK